MIVGGDLEEQQKSGNRTVDHAGQKGGHTDQGVTAARTGNRGKGRADEHAAQAAQDGPEVERREEQSARAARGQGQAGGRYFDGEEQQ